MLSKDWTLLVIAARGGGALQPVHLQKILFLISEQLSSGQLGTKEFYEFFPYDYGPFCVEVYSDAELLERNGLVHIDQPPLLSYRLYSATENGIAEAKRLKEGLEPNVSSYLDRLVDNVSKLSFRQLVNAVYKAYPRMKVNSVFQE